MSIRHCTDDSRSDERSRADERIREEVERTGGVWAQMSPADRERVLGRLHEKKQRAREARARREAVRDVLTERVAALEERVAQLERAPGSSGK
jgi:predicted Fe-S protein YdhL (DUF1289 family)